jgi:hypothetical protein
MLQFTKKLILKQLSPTLNNPAFAGKYQQTNWQIVNNPSNSERYNPAEASAARKILNSEL